MIGVGLLAVPVPEAFAGEFCTIVDPVQANMRAWLDEHTRRSAPKQVANLMLGG